MDAELNPEGDMRARVDRLESALSALSSRMDAMAGSTERAAEPPRPRPATAAPVPTRPHAARPTAPPRGADWWLARAGAVLTCFAVILLYQYAVGHGWITPLIRVFTGIGIGAALMYWGRRIAPAASDQPSPVALRELMMGAGLAAWYITAFAASVLYQLIPVSTSRLLFLALSITGGVLSLKERRSGLAIIAVGAGFMAPVVLSADAPSITALVFFLATLGGLSVVLYLMRGWQSVLWIAFLALYGSVASATGNVLFRSPYNLPGGAHLPFLDLGRISLTLLIVAVGVMFARAPTLRRKLVATGSPRYTEPTRSLFVQTWLSETGRFFNLFSPRAGALDSLTVWLITLAAPVAAIGLLSSAWPLVSDFAWGALMLVIGVIAFQMCASAGEADDELTHFKGVAGVLWSLAGVITIGAALAPLVGVDIDAVSLGAVALSAAIVIGTFKGPRLIAAVAVGRLMAAVGIVIVIFTELALLGSPSHGVLVDPIRTAFSIAEVASIGAAFLAWREMKRNSTARYAITALACLGYLAFILVDTRVLGAVWTPLVTASFAIAGTALLLVSRKNESKVVRLAGGATIALVIGRLLFVDLVGVDTIWRVLLFLGCGALFLFTSRQMQSASKQTTSQSA